MINKKNLYWITSFIIFTIFGVLLDLNISLLNFNKFYENEDEENEIASINFTIFFNKKFSISNDKELITNILDQYLIGSYLKEPKYYVKTISEYDITGVKLDDLIKFQNFNFSNLSNYINQIKVKLRIYSSNKDYNTVIEKYHKLYFFLKDEIENKFDKEFINFIDFNFLDKYNLQISRIYDAALNSKFNSGLITLDIDNIFMYEAFSNFVEKLNENEKKLFLSKIKLNNNLAFEDNVSNVYLYSNILENEEKIALIYFEDKNIFYTPVTNITNTFPIITLAFIFLYLLLFLSVKVFKYK